MVKLDLGHVHIKVGDLQRSLKFYEGLGFKVHRIPMDKGEYVSIELSRGSIEPDQTEDWTGPKGFTIGVSVDNVEQVYQLAKAIGAEVLHSIRDQPWGVRNFYIKDPDGYVIEFDQKLKK